MEKTIKSSYRGRMKEREFTVNARILARRDDLAEALASSADVTETRVRREGGEMTLSGRINVRVLCIDEERKPVALNYNVDYDESFEADEIGEDATVAATVSVEEMTVRILGGREAEITLRCKARGEVCRDYETTAEEMPEGVITKTESVSVGRISARSENRFTVTHETPLPAGETLLQTDAGAIITGASVSDEVLTLSGKVFFRPVYMTEEDLPRATLTAVPFTEEIEAKGFSGGTPLAEVKVTDLRVRITEEEGASFLNAEFTLSATATDFVLQSEECVKDCYSTDYELIKTEAEIIGAVYKGMTLAEVGFGGNVPCDEPAARVLGLFDTGASGITAEAGEGTVQLSGMVTGSFVYLDADDKIRSQTFALPFAALVSVPECTERSEVTADALVTDAAVRRNGSGADVAGTITVTLNAVSNEKRRIIGSVLLGEKKEPSGAAIEAVIAEAGEDAWSVGKALNMRPEDVLELNPRLSEPLSEPTRIVVYHKL